MLVLLRSAIGLQADVPGGVVTVRPDPAFADLFPLTAVGLQVGGCRLDVTVDANGRAAVDTDAAVRVLTK